MSYLPKSCHAFHMASLRMRDLTLTNDEVDHASSCFNMVRYVDMVAVANYMYIDVFATPFPFMTDSFERIEFYGTLAAHQEQTARIDYARNLCSRLYRPEQSD